MNYQNKKPMNLDNATPFDVFLWGTMPEISKASNDLIDDMYSKRKYRNIGKKNRVKNTLKIVLSNLYHTFSQDKNMWIAVHRDKNKYVSRKRMNRLFIHYKHLMKIIEYLEENKFIKNIKGFYNHKDNRKSRCSRIIAQNKLIKLLNSKKESSTGKYISRKIGIIIKDKYKKILPLVLGDSEQKMFRNVQKINRELRKHKISIQTTSVDPKTQRDINLSSYRTRYYRVFNNSSIKQGGRFYGHWIQNIPKILRKYLLIDGQKTIELDYSCLHLSILYAEQGIKIQKGCDLYTKGILLKYDRNIVKNAINISLNTATKNSLKCAINNYLHNEYNGKIRATELISDIESEHPILAGKLGTNEGLKLQNKDSMLAEQIMLNLFEQNICTLCIHDSFIVQEIYKEKLYNTMRDVFYKMFGKYPQIK